MQFDGQTTPKSPICLLCYPTTFMKYGTIFGLQVPNFQFCVFTWNFGQGALFCVPEKLATVSDMCAVDIPHGPQKFSTFLSVLQQPLSQIDWVCIRIPPKVKTTVKLLAQKKTELSFARPVRKYVPTSANDHNDSSLLLSWSATQTEVAKPLDHNQPAASCLLLYSTSETYPSISRLVHINLEFPSISNKIEHPLILQRRWILVGKYRLHQTN